MKKITYLMMLALGLGVVNAGPNLNEMKENTQNFAKDFKEAKLGKGRKLKVMLKHGKDAIERHPEIKQALAAAAA